MKKFITALLILLPSLALAASAPVIGGKEGARLNGSLEMKYLTTPANPAAGSLRLYPKDDGKVYKLLPDGTESELGANIFGDYATFEVTDLASNTWSADIPAIVFDGAMASGSYGAGLIFDGDANEGDLLLLTRDQNSATDSSGINVISGQQNGSGQTGYVQLLSGHNAGTGLSGSATVGTGGTVTGTSGSLTLKTGNSQNEGNTGSIYLFPGTTTGTRGGIVFIDGSEGTAGHVWTSTATDGTGSWAALPAAPTFDSLSPMTTNGDLITRAAGEPARLGIGSTDDVLTVVGGAPAWRAPLVKSTSSALPTCDSSLRGLTYHIESGTDVPDLEATCKKQKDGTYAWYYESEWQEESTIFGFKDANEGAINTGNVNWSKHRLKREGRFLLWEMEYGYSGNLGGGAILFFKMPTWGGVDLQKDTTYIFGGDATTHAGSDILGWGTHWNGSSHAVYWALNGLGMLTAADRPYYVKLLNTGGGNITSNTSSGHHTKMWMKIPISGWQ